MDQHNRFLSFLPEDTEARWIWPARLRDSVNQYVEFTQDVQLGHVPHEACLVISTDTAYACWINGQFVESQQFADFPGNKRYDSIELNGVLTRGRNVVRLLVYYQGFNSTRYVKGAPGVIFALKTEDASFSSGSSALYRVAPFYRSGPMPLLSPQLSFTFEYDARACRCVTGDTCATDWGKVSAQDICPQSPERKLLARDVRRQVLGERVTSRIVAQGVFRRRSSPEDSPAALIQRDYLSARRYDELYEGLDGDVLLRRSFMNILLPLPIEDGWAIASGALDDNDGVYIVVDLGAEEAGLLDIELDTDRGTVVDIAFGEHLDDLRVRATGGGGGMHFASRYVCREGRQAFLHRFTRWGCRYLQLHVSGFTSRCVIYYAGLRPQYYPVEVRGGFSCGDSLHNRIYDTSVRTLQLCMHEHYEDCPWREQALYSNDSSNQALAGYYCFGEYDFPYASFSLLGESLDKLGYLGHTAPSDIPETIPSFTFAWVKAVRDLYLHSGREDVLQDQYPHVEAIMTCHIDRMTDGLLPDPQGHRYWHFHDWAPGLAGLHADRIERTVASADSYNALLNLSFGYALAMASQLADASGDGDARDMFSEKAGEIKGAFHSTFWESREDAYCTHHNDEAGERFHELTQAMTLLDAFVPAELESPLRQRLSGRDSGLVETTLSQSYCKLEALMQEPERYASTVFDMIARDWGHMLFNGATAFWEVIEGASANGGGRSLCHGWSGIPAYFYQAYVLGVRPLEPGFRRFRLAPSFLLGDVRGRVPTPAGTIEVELLRTPDGNVCRYSHPQGTVPLIHEEDSRNTAFVLDVSHDGWLA